MKSFLKNYLLGQLVFLFFIYISNENLNIWPKPRKAETGQNSITIDCGCSIAYVIMMKRDEKIPSHVQEIIELYHKII